MPLDVNLIKNRLKEAVNGDVQEMIAEKLNLSQSTVSRLLSGQQVPTTEVLCIISDVYGVSIDWLLGKSDVKHIETGEEWSYAEVVESMLELCRKEAVEVIDYKKERGTKTQAVVINDPLLLRLVKTGHSLQNADYLSCENWIKERLSLFRGQPVLWSIAWQDESVDFLFGEARNEAHLLEVYKAGKKAEDMYSDVMRPDPGPFDD